MTTNQKSIYERIGGEAAVNAAVDVFYRRVLSDERISHHFDAVDMDRQRAKQKAFLTFAFGGPNHYSGRDLRTAHASMHLEERDLGAVLEHLLGTLTDLGVPPELRSEVEKIALSVKDDVLNR
jgi:hemoglobin